MEEIMNFSSETKVKDIALAAPSARRILENAGLDYCCGGGKSLAEACLRANTSAEEILKQLRGNSQQVDPAEQQWTKAPLQELTGHIRDKHHRWVREAIPRINMLLTKVRTKHGANHPELTEIQALFSEVGRAMIMHMQKEEQILFPYIDELERSVNEHREIESPFFQTVRSPVHAMMNEHDAAGDLVKQIRKATAAYAAPDDACASYKGLYENLREFEADLHQHVHLENNILFPRAVDMEASVASGA
jgi:regulator of cell morphogenesis and NO signaling